MKRFRVTHSVAALLLLAAAADAETACVFSTATGIQPVLKRGTAREAVEAAMSEKNPAQQEKKLRELMECGVAPGTRVKILEAGVGFDTIEVLDGETKGCTGEILRSSLGACPPAKK